MTTQPFFPLERVPEISYGFDASDLSLQDGDRRMTGGTAARFAALMEVKPRETIIANIRNMAQRAPQARETITRPDAAVYIHATQDPLPYDFLAPQ
jgi:hypothetical protein